jgi:hypothetical protein
MKLFWKKLNKHDERVLMAACDLAAQRLKQHIIDNRNLPPGNQGCTQKAGAYTTAGGDSQWEWHEPAFVPRLPEPGRTLTKLRCVNNVQATKLSIHAKHLSWAEARAGRNACTLVGTIFMSFCCSCSQARCFPTAPVAKPSHSKPCRLCRFR